MPKQKRKHCSELPDVRVKKHNLILTRHFIMQEDDSSTVEDGITVSSSIEGGMTSITTNRGTSLTEEEHEDDMWFITEEDILSRAIDECGKESPIVAGLNFLMRALQDRSEKLEGLYAEVEELVNCDILTDECDLAKNLKQFKP